MTAPNTTQRKFFIVWNQAKSEGFITDDRNDALYVSECISGRFGNPTVGEAFRESYAEDDDDVLLMQEVMLAVELKDKRK